MITLKVNNGSTFSIDFNKEEVTLNGKQVASDWTSFAPHKYHVIFNHQSYTLELLGADEAGKQLTLMVNGQKQVVAIEDQYDALLKQLGMDKMVANKVNEVKAPMPGLVLRILVEEGQAVKKGDALLVLEAMKMENIIKATGEGVIKKIAIQPKLAVEKNQVMLVME
ncbi:MAG: biotin/lipoyl-containing protein [Bacteroidota bacterium]